MSQKERNRLAVLVQVKNLKLQLVQAAELMDVGYRQAKRLWARYRSQGDAGLVHQARGRPSPRQIQPRLRAQVLARYRERYPDFGPTLAAEHLAAEGLKVDHETLRRWLLREGLREVRRRGQRHRQRRERKECFGQMVQMDGSLHDWFEGRGPKAVLMVMIDDATNRTYAQFFEQETTGAGFEMLEGWAGLYGLPGSLYVDRDSIYRAEGLPSVAEQLAGQVPRTQFGRAMERLGIGLIMAHSPQAKGRVERRHRLFQDRLVKALRLAGISDVASANAYLRKKFLPLINRRFTLAPAQAADVHRPVPRELGEVLSWEYERVVQLDWTVSWEGRCFQIQAEHERLSLARKRVTVRELRDGRVQLIYGGRKLRWRELSQRPQRAPDSPRRIGRTELTKPQAGHPWRQFGRGTGRVYWSKVKVAGRVARREASPLLGDSGRPALRSGLPSSPRRGEGQDLRVNGG